MNDTLKVAMGAELGAAKAENEKLRGLLTTAWRLRPDQHYHEDHLQAEQKAWEIEVAEVLNAAGALPQQAEPTDAFTAVDMATAAAQGFRDGQAAVEPAPAQDERAAFEAWVMQHNTAVREDYDDTDENAPEDIRLDRQGGVYIWANAEAAWFAWKARSALDTRPAQTAPVPSAAQQILDLIMEECRYWHGRDEARRGNFANLYAAAKELADNTAPIAQTAPQGKFRMGDLVKKSTGSEWVGHVCGWYSTEQTPEGYAVESSAHRNSVQIYPAKALEAVE